MVDIYIGEGREFWFEDEMYHQEFLTDLAKAFMDVTGEPREEIGWLESDDDPTRRWRSPEKYLEAEESNR